MRWAVLSENPDAIPKSVMLSPLLTFTGVRRREARERESEGKCEGERRAGTVRATGGEISMSVIELGVDDS